MKVNGDAISPKSKSWKIPNKRTKSFLYLFLAVFFVNGFFIKNTQWIYIF